MRNLLKWAIYVGLLSLFGMLSFHAHAASTCRTTKSQWVVQVPYTIGYAPGADDWSAISPPIPSTGSDFYNCEGSQDGWRAIGFMESDTAVHTVTAEDGSRRHIYQTQIPGIGYAIGLREPQYCGSSDVRYIGDNNTIDNGESLRICDSSQNAAFATATSYQLQFYVVFYKIPTDNPMANDNANSQEQNVGKLVLQAGDGPDTASLVAGPVELHLASFTARRTSCLVGSPVIPVAMGTVNVSEFNGVGSTAGGGQFTIPVNCENNTAVKIGFFGETAPGNNKALALTKQVDSASGVGIELTYGDNTGQAQGQVVEWNTQQVPELGQSGNNTTQSYSFEAKYIQTEENISPGKADAMATFNLIYN